MDSINALSTSKSIQDLDDLTLCQIFDCLDTKTLICCTLVCDK